MPEALLIRLRPAGPWRFGADSGASLDTGDLYHSDSLFSAVTHAMARLGELEEWLDATARSTGEPAVRFSSCYPWQGETLLVVPPRHVWPPALSPRLRLDGVRFVPVSAAQALLDGRPLSPEDYSVDAPSRCLLEKSSAGRGVGPLRYAVRDRAPVDRLRRTSDHVHRTACVEFGPEAGLWLVAAFAGDAERSRWATCVEAAFRLLADSGFGGRRSIGWGRSEAPRVTSGPLPDLLLPGLGRPPAEAPPADEPTEEESSESDTAPAETGYWLLSLFRPAPSDTVDWDRGSYSLVTRGGRTESPAGSGEEKKLVRMVTEGSLLLAGREPVGSAADVAPEGFAHPVYRYGYPVSIPVSIRTAQ